MMLERLNTFWDGPRLGYLEQLSVMSALEQGHAYTVYSYEPDRLDGVPEGAELRDAREVMTDPRRTKYFAGRYKALGTDFFRYELLAKGLGYWVDLDLIFLRPLDLDTPYVFGWEGKGSLNGAVLKIPSGSAMLEALRTIPERNWCPPFYGPRRRLAYYWRRLRGDVELDDMPWGVAGPAMITYLAKELGLAGQAQAKPVFYPLDYADAPLLFEPAERMAPVIALETRAIHMWHSRLHGLADRPPPAGSYIDVLCRRYQIDTGGTLPG